MKPKQILAYVVAALSFTVYAIAAPVKPAMTTTGPFGSISANGNLTVSGNANIAGRLAVNSNVTVAGNANVAGPLFANSNVTVAGNANVAGPLFANSNVTVAGNANVAGPLYVTGNANVTGQIFMPSTSAVLQIGTGTADSAGTIFFGDRTAAGVQLRKYGAGSSLYLMTGTQSAAALYLGTLRPVSIIGGDSATPFSMCCMTKTEATSAAGTITVGAVDSFITYNNVGALSLTTWNLPACTTAGRNGIFVNGDGGAAFGKVQANGTDKIAQAGANGVSGSYLLSTGIWSSVSVECIKSGQWFVTNTTGSPWTLN